MSDETQKSKYVDPQREREKSESLTREKESQQRDKEGRAKYPSYDKDKSDARVADPHWRALPGDPRGNS